MSATFLTVAALLIKRGQETWKFPEHEGESPEIRFKSNGVSCISFVAAGFVCRGAVTGSSEAMGLCK